LLQALVAVLWLLCFFHTPAIASLMRAVLGLLSSLQADKVPSSMVALLVGGQGCS
jgi:hypothetical protein